MENNKKILIVEDEEILLNVLEKRLVQEGFSVFLARDGEEGLKKAKEVLPDLILLDILMPKKDGFEVLEALHKDKDLKEVPVIIISNSGQNVEIDRALKLGVKDYLIKTEFDPRQVIEKTKKQLNLSESMENSKKTDAPETMEAAEEKKDTAEKSQESSSDILIIEDDKFLRDLIKRKLEEEGYQVTEAVDGQEGLKQIKENRPKLILLDLILPGIHGFEVLKQVKQNSQTASIPVIILSNLGQKEDIVKGMNLGAVDFMIKAHFTPAEIVKKIKSVLGF